MYAWLTTNSPAILCLFCCAGITIKVRVFGQNDYYRTLAHAVRFLQSVEDPDEFAAQVVQDLDEFAAQLLGDVAGHMPVPAVPASGVLRQGKPDAIAMAAAGPSPPQLAGSQAKPLLARRAAVKRSHHDPDGETLCHWECNSCTGLACSVFSRA